MKYLTVDCMEFFQMRHTRHPLHWYIRLPLNKLLPWMQLILCTNTTATKCRYLWMGAGRDLALRINICFCMRWCLSLVCQNTSLLSVHRLQHTCRFMLSPQHGLPSISETHSVRRNHVKLRNIFCLLKNKTKQETSKDVLQLLGVISRSLRNDLE